MRTPVAVAAARARARGPQTDRFETERTEFFERVRAAYLAILAREPGRVHRVDATQAIEAVAQDVAGSLDQLAVRGALADGP